MKGMKYDTIIVGGGVFGSIIGRHLMEQGSVAIFEAGLPHNGLDAAGCLIKPSWSTKVPHRDLCMDLLETYFGVDTVPFGVMTKHFKMDDVWVVNKQAIKEVPKIYAKVSRWQSNGVHVGKTFYAADRVIVCVGGHGDHQKPKWGRSYEFDNHVVEPLIKPWRPFTQLVRFNMSSDMVWAGDGTAVNEWTGGYSEKTQLRVEEFVGRSSTRQILGMRPYVHGLKEPALIMEQNGITHVTGGAKNGTIGAAWAALKIGGDI